MSNRTRKPRTFCVRFSSITDYKLTVQARSADEAIAKVKRKWLYGNSDDFIPFSSDDQDWDAEEE